MSRVGILHPGAMGSALGAALRSVGHDVRWARSGRSDATAERAHAADLGEVETVAELTARCELVVSVCPPAAAIDVAREVAGADFSGRYCDANAIAPETARRVAHIVAARGAAPLDAGIVGPPPAAANFTRMFVSGDDADSLVDLFARTHVETVVVGGGIGAASAVKIAYAGWTKGSAALLLAIRAFARAEGVEEPLLEEWDRSQPGLADRSAGAVFTAPKAWRFVGEMREIASALDAAGLPGEFHEAAASLYESLAWAKDKPSPNIDEVLESLTACRDEQSEEGRP